MRTSMCALERPGRGGQCFSVSDQQHGRNSMDLLPQGPDGWNRAAFRLLLLCAIISIAFFFWANNAQFSYDHLWNVLHGWELASQRIALCLGLPLHVWSLYFLVDRRQGYRDGDVAYGLSGFCVSIICVAIFFFQDTAKPR